MKLLRATIYAAITFLAFYAILAVSFRIFELTTDFNAHVYAGIIATFIAVLLFVFLVIKKKKSI